MRTMLAGTVAMAVLSCGPKKEDKTPPPEEKKMSEMETKPAAKRDLTFTRVFDAPVEKAWRAWSEPGEVMKWWGPDQFSCPSAKLDLREGGTSLICMRAPASFGGQDMYSIWAYRRSSR